MSGYESGKFKPGDTLPTGETFIGETEDGSPLWGEPVTTPARSPVDDALDQLEGCITRVKDGTIIVGRTSEEDADAALATVRSALEQLREERDMEVLARGSRKLQLAAEAEVRRLMGELQTEYVKVRRLTAELKHAREGLRVIQAWDCLNPPDPNLCADHPWLKRHVDALLSASRPSVPAGEPEDIPIDYERADLEYRIEREVMGSDVKSFLNEPDGGGT